MGDRARSRGNSGGRPLRLDLGAAERVSAAARSRWHADDATRRLWAADASLWTGTDEGRWLGWLGATELPDADLARLEAFACSAQERGLRHLLLVGMGGSSLAAEVLGRSLPAVAGFPSLRVLDSTVPAAIQRCERELDLTRTLLLVASKSGHTIEARTLAAYFRARLSEALGAREAARRCAVITDPGTALEAEAREGGFGEIFHGKPEIGGRFSALSNFGLVPAALLGIDIRELLARAARMARACAPEVPVDRNPAVALGLTLAALAEQGRDKLTLVCAPGIQALGGWIEQMVAESTGKSGRGIVPIDGEALADPSAYGSDRVFLQTRVESLPCPEQEVALARIERAGHPVLRITLDDPLDLGQAFFCWQLATAVLGSALGVHPFNQPDVDAAKDAARRLMVAFEASGRLDEPTPFLCEDGISLYAAGATPETMKGVGSIRSALQAHLSGLQPGDYLAICAYLDPCDASHRELQRMRHVIRDATRAATTLGYGPRFLHSSGQLHKGGPNRGVFLQVTARTARDISIPDHSFSFGILVSAQAHGDYAVLAERGRRILRVHLGGGLESGLQRLVSLIEGALVP